MQNPNVSNRSRLNIPGLTVLLILLVNSTYFIGCKKYLDVKSDKVLAVPATLKDAQAILDNYRIMNTFYSSAPSQSDDDFYLNDAYVNTLSTETRTNYTWERDAYNASQWFNLYTIVFYANTALETVERVEKTVHNATAYNRVKGAALFFRAYAFSHIVQQWAPPYDKATAAKDPGIPVRLTPAATVVSTRATVEESYNRILTDLKEAADLLPETVPLSARPSKAAAFGALARTYLAMREYHLAGLYADSCLQISDTLLDFNTVSSAPAAPFALFHPEVILQTQFLGTGMLNSNNWRADSSLYKAYVANDLRRTLFFRSNGAGNYGFRGSYNGVATGAHFNGLAVDEMYLIRAEARARQGNTAAALEDLNTLLEKRWKEGNFTPYTAADAGDALRQILAERRKELVGRGLRWYDLRRLNKEPAFAKTLVRKVDGTLYELPPNGERYTFYLPAAVIEMTGMVQNNR